MMKNGRKSSKEKVERERKKRIQKLFLLSLEGKKWKERQEKFMKRVKETRKIWKEKLIEDRAKIQELLGQLKSQDPPNKELEKEAEETLDPLAKMMELLTVV